MADIQGDFGNLIHGVSSQPDERKFKGQCKEQVNCRSNVTKGLERRGAMKLLAVLTETAAGAGELYNAKFTIMESNPYPLLVGLGLNAPKVWDLEGVPRIFGWEDGVNGPIYYKHSVDKPLRERFYEHTTLDTMFITNTEVIPEVTPVTSVIPDRALWIEFPTFQPGTEILISDSSGVIYGPVQVFDGFVPVSSAGVPDPAFTERTKEYSGSYHAEQFAAANPAWVQYNNWVFNGLTTDTIKIDKGGAGLVLYDADDIKAIEKLPPIAYEGIYAVVSEGAGEDVNEGYFRAVSQLGTGVVGPVSWSESSKDGEEQDFVPETMPHKLYRTAPDTLIFSKLDWSGRQVGDVDSNPVPSFVSNATPIDTINFFQNRLILTSGEIVLASASDAYYDLFNSSAFYNTDADPFESFANTEKINNIKFSTQHDGDFIMFSQNSQFIMSGDINHTYSTAYIQAIGQYKSNLTALPVSTGDAVMFGFNYGTHAGVRELFTNEANEGRKAQPITTHVNDFIGGNITQLTTSTNVDAVVALSDSEPSSLFVYEYLTLDGKREQQSWSKWTAPEGSQITWAGFYEADLYVVLSNGVTGFGNLQLLLVVINWDDLNTGTLDFPVKLDFLTAITAITYDAGTNRSSWVSPVQRLDLVFVEEGTEDPGFVVNASYDEGTLTWSAEGDLTGATLWSGIPFESSYTFANPVIRDREGVAQSLDRLQLGSLSLHFTTVGQLNFTHTDERGRAKTVTYNNRRINAINNLPSTVPTEASDWRVPLRKKAKGLDLRLHTNDITPFTVRAVEYRGEYQQRGRRR